MGKKGKESSHHHNGEDPEAPLPPQPAPPPGYQAIPASSCEVPEEKPSREGRCCGCGTGWCMFISGFFLAAVPWYIAAFILMCGKVGRREKPGYIACTIAAVGVTVALTYDWMTTRIGDRYFGPGSQVS